MSVPESGSHKFLGIDFSKLSFTKGEVTEDKVRDGLNSSLNQLVAAKTKSQAARAKAAGIGLEWLEKRKAEFAKVLSENREKKIIGKIIKELKRTIYVSDKTLKKATPEKLAAYLVKINFILSIVETFGSKDGKTLDPAIQADLKEGLDHLYEKKRQILLREEMRQGTYIGLTQRLEEEGGTFAAKKDSPEIKELKKKIIEKEQSIKLATNLVRTIEKKIEKAKSVEEIEQLRSKLHAQLKILDDNLGKLGNLKPIEIKGDEFDKSGLKPKEIKEARQIAADLSQIELIRLKLANQGVPMGSFRLLSRIEREQLENELNRKRDYLKGQDEKAIEAAVKKAKIKFFWTITNEKIATNILESLHDSFVEFSLRGGTDLKIFKNEIKITLKVQAIEMVDKYYKGEANKAEKARYKESIDQLTDFWVEKCRIAQEEMKDEEKKATILALETVELEKMSWRTTNNTIKKDIIRAEIIACNAFVRFGGTNIDVFINKLREDLTKKAAKIVAKSGEFKDPEERKIVKNIYNNYIDTTIEILKKVINEKKANKIYINLGEASAKRVREELEKGELEEDKARKAQRNEKRARLMNKTLDAFQASLFFILG